MSASSRAGPSLSAGNTAATAASSRRLATSCATSEKSRDKPPKPAAPTAAPNLRGRRPETDTCSTKSASRRGRDSPRRAATEQPGQGEEEEEKEKRKRKKEERDGERRKPAWAKTKSGRHTSLVLFGSNHTMIHTTPSASTLWKFLLVYQTSAKETPSAIRLYGSNGRRIHEHLKFTRRPGLFAQTGPHLSAIVGGYHCSERSTW